MKFSIFASFFYLANAAQQHSYPSCFETYYKGVAFKKMSEVDSFKNLDPECQDILNELVQAAQLPGDLTLNDCLEEYGNTFFIRHWMSLLQRINRTIKLRMTLLATFSVDKRCLFQVHRKFFSQDLGYTPEEMETCQREFVEFLKTETLPSIYSSFVKFGKQKNVNCCVAIHHNVMYGDGKAIQPALVYINSWRRMKQFAS